MLVDDPVSAYPHLPEQLHQVMWLLRENLVCLHFPASFGQLPVTDVHHCWETTVHQLDKGYSFLRSVERQVPLKNVASSMSLESLNSDKERLVWELPPQLFPEQLLIRQQTDTVFWCFVED